MSFWDVVKNMKAIELESKIDMNKLALSDGNVLPESEVTYQEYDKPFRFLDLPRKVRDRIYELVLVPKVPIEFALLIRGQRYEDFWKGDVEPYETARLWYKYHYLDFKVALMLLRTNKQINREATPIFYGQPFRFSNQSGWLTLYHWMESIGGDKWDMIKDITICHPSFMSFPKYIGQTRNSCGGFAFSLGMWSLYEDRYEEKAAGMELKPYQKNGDCCGPEIDPVDLISYLPSLRNLRLILTCTQRADLWGESPGMHPILDVDTPAGLSIQAISLMPYYSPRPSNIIDNTAEEFGSITCCPGDTRPSFICGTTKKRFLDEVVGFEGAVTPDEADAIQKAYGDLRNKNVKLVGMFYDDHCHFPVFPNEDCVNTDLCLYIVNQWSNFYAYEAFEECCCGTKGEREATGFCV
ncbi:hypothetical protein KC351_g2346 [Hortaea werneckii]|nr:hypothetical protein KC351_g2346 [Hortaea werneckii]